MKNIFLKNTLLLVAILGLGCKEIPIEIPAVRQTINSPRKVLIEEFTGIRCQNCPQGSAEIANLKSLFGNSLVVVSVHAGTFSAPLPESKQNFQTGAGTNLESYLGTPLGYPSAVVDRRHFPGIIDLQAFKGQWSGFIKKELLDTLSQPSLNLNPIYDNQTRNLSVNLTISPKVNLSGEYRISVLITEDHIIDAQEVGSILVEDYEHEHVLREMLTPFDGAVISENLVFGAPISRNYSFTLPVGWVAQNCHVVAFVHHGGVPDKAVIQVEEKPIL
jgi:hypothetical protein